MRFWPSYSPTFHPPQSGEKRALMAFLGAKARSARQAPRFLGHWRHWDWSGVLIWTGLCLLLFLATYRFSQIILFQMIEAKVPHRMTYSYQSEGRYYGFDIRGTLGPDQEALFERALGFFPPDSLLAFSQGQSNLIGHESQLTFFVLDQQEFNNLASWYQDERQLQTLDGFYTKNKIFIRQNLPEKRFLETLTHELVHAYDDFQVLDPWYAYLFETERGLIDLVGGELKRHKDWQVFQAANRLNAADSNYHRYLLKTAQGQTHSFLNNSPRVLKGELKRMVKAFSCCFVSLYAVFGEEAGAGTQPNEYWAESYMAYYLYPTVLKQKDPLLYQSIDRLDRYLRTPATLRRRQIAADTFLRTLNRGAIYQADLESFNFSFNL